jgi:beta-glucosidase
MKFPDGFLWGTATAAHQVEGGNVNSDYWVLEHVNGTSFTEPSGDACDHYHRYREDIELMARLGFNSYRFSVEWARIEPEDGEFSLAALEHYRRLMGACRDHGITPVLTLHHFTSPRWVAGRGGWENPRTAEKFGRYAERVGAHLGDMIGLACTINEINLAILLQHSGIIPQDEKIPLSPSRREAAQVVGSDAEHFSAFPFFVRSISRDVLLNGHRRAVEALHSGPGKFGVGMTLALQDLQAVPGGEQLRDKLRFEIEDYFTQAARRDDFVGVQTYTRQRLGADGLIGPEPGVELTQMGYEFCPQALEATIRRAAQIAGVPIYVTENGIATADDSRRIAFAEGALAGVARCLRDGIDVRGYFYWSMLDNFEWLFGYRPRFGLIAVDRVTQKRTVKRSAEFLGRIAQTNTTPWNP